MPTFSRLQWLTAASAFVLAAGLLFLAVISAAESAFTPGTTIIDGYWAGRLPWMGIAEGWIVGGATACVVVASLTVLAHGGWVRRLAVLPPALLALFWWFVAMQLPRQAVPCTVCPPREPDPWAYAYSLPETAALGLLLPAAVLVAIALARSARPATRGAPVIHDVAKSQSG